MRAKAVVVLAIYFATAAFLRTGLVDDTYIYLRYADNVAAGHGPVFNPGERVEGFTSPLWLALLVPVAASRLPLPATARWLSGALGAATLLLFLFAAVRLPRDGEPDWPLAAAIFLATSPALVYWSFSGMETALVTLLTLAAVATFIKENAAGLPRWRSAAALGLGMLARPEAVLVWVALFALQVADGRARLRRDAVAYAAAALPLALYEAWRIRYYGAFLPNTYYAKMAGGALDRWTAGARYLARFALAHELHVAVLVVGLLLLSRQRRFASHEHLPLLTVSAAWCAACVVAGGDHFAGFRFLVPTLAPIVMLLLSLLAGAPRPLLQAPPRHAKTRFALAVAAGLLVNLSVLEFHTVSSVRLEIGLADRWANAGRWLALNTPPGATICVPVAGAIPYYARRPAVDMLGLVDRHIARVGKVTPTEPAGHQRSDTDYVLSRRPDYIIYPSSGCCPTPKYAADPFHAPESLFAFRELVADPRTRERYAYRAAEIAGGRWIEFLQLRPEK